MLTALARYYWRTSARQLFFASLSGTVSENLDADRADSAWRRQWSARLSVALPGRFSTRAADAGASRVHEVLPVPAVSSRRRGVLRHRPNVGAGHGRSRPPRDYSRMSVSACVLVRAAHPSAASFISIWRFRSTATTASMTCNFSGGIGSRASGSERLSPFRDRRPARLAGEMRSHQ